MLNGCCVVVVGNARTRFSRDKPVSRKNLKERAFKGLDKLSVEREKSGEISLPSLLALPIHSNRMFRRKSVCSASLEIGNGLSLELESNASS